MINTQKTSQPLKKQDSVRSRPMSLGDNLWIKAKLIKCLNERFYLLDNGKRILRRNRVDLHKVPDTEVKENTSSHSVPGMDFRVESSAVHGQVNSDTQLD